MASDIAEYHCAQVNTTDIRLDRAWLPQPVKDHETGMYMPFMRQVWVSREHIIVLGRDDDWKKVGSGAKVGLVPEDKFSTDDLTFGQGRFDTLFARGSTDASFEQHRLDPRRSDFYVRAFRIKT
jgi:hypothetical protein